MSPLSDRLRPKNLDQIIGQKHILASDKLLYKTIRSGNIFSMIFWGPPGVGKTTLARVIANELQTEFYEFSAVSTSIVELKKLFENLTEKSGQLKITKSPVIFIDEIHRFNKLQQDAFLPHIENGSIILIGATTENPSFEVIGPLLSRSRVFVLNQLTEDELKELVNAALKNKENGLGNLKIKLEKDAQDFLIEGSNGDARVLLNALEIAANAATLENKKYITKNNIEEALQKRGLLYDKAGDEHYDTISAFIKSMRASNVDGALYYLARMVSAGEDPKFIARRMVIFASEDIGIAQPTALVVANAVFRAVESIGYPECQINLAHGVTYLCEAKKDRSAHDAYFRALEDVQKYGNLEIPMNLRNAPTKLMKDIGYGKGYKNPVRSHSEESIALAPGTLPSSGEEGEKYSDKDLLPEKLKGKKYYKVDK